MYTKLNLCCACTCAANANDADYDTEAVLVAAGEACAGLCGELPAVAAAEAEAPALPQTYIVPQAYAYGFCPGESLQRGTMFPELVG